MAPSSRAISPHITPEALSARATAAPVPARSTASCLRATCVGAVILGLIGLAAAPAGAHGLVGRRFFPATLAIEDPFVADELALPSFSYLNGSEGKETSIGVELQKSITRDLGISIGAEYLILDPADPEEGNVSGFANPEISVKYTLLRNEPHEAIVSLAFGWEPGGVGKKAVGASSSSSVSPSLLFGKGFGDLPESVPFLRPLAVTGFFGAEIPFAREEATALTYGIAIEYSLPYLQQFVRDVGLPRFLGQLIPLVELVFETPIEGTERWKTTGTVNPGILWVGKFVEVGVEAIVPINAASGKDVGVRALLHFFLDDLWPTVFRPIIR